MTVTMQEVQPRTRRRPQSLHEFPLLARPDDYVACRLDLAEHQEDRAYWLDLFRWHIDKLIEEARGQFAGEANLEERLAGARRTFTAYLDAVALEPRRFGRLDIIAICWAREWSLREAGIGDAYRNTKARENEAALKLLPALLRELDAMSDAERPARLVEGVFAGNIFDLGATQTLELFQGKSIDFHAVRRKLKPRPWLIDDADAFVDRWRTRGWRSAVLFVDNAGPDILLGMMPLARELLRRGTEVLLTANTFPSLNDVTYEELMVLVDRVGQLDAVIRDAYADGRLELAPSGNDVPLIDMAKVSAELCEAVKRRGVDLVVLEGMGRGIESNLHVPFACDSLKIAMVKDPGVARLLGGQMYDLVCRYEPADKQ